MTYENFKNVKKSLDELGKMRLPFYISKKIFCLNKELKSEYEFFEKEMMKLVDQYALKEENGKPRLTLNGRLTFNTVEDMSAYEKEFSELLNKELELNIHLPIKISESLMEEKDISPETLINLEGIIEFE